MSDALHPESRPDWVEWCASLPPKVAGRTDAPAFPDPHDDGGLPMGWRVVSRYAKFGKDNYDAVLARCPDGQWVQIYHARPESNSAHSSPYASLLDMYEAALSRAVSSAAPRTTEDLFPADVAGWIRRVLLRSYNPNIPEEAAEQMVVALGGTPRLMPVVLTSSLPLTV